MAAIRKVQVIDSHTGGEPTRVVVSGGPALGNGTLAERRRVFETRFDHFRSAIINEPRGSDALVGGLLCDPVDPACSAGVIFFNNVGYLGMCGHGAMGLMVTLAHLGRVGAGLHRIETPVGVIEAQLHESGEVSVSNVPSYRLRAGVSVDVRGFGRVTGEVAWGGNWFFLTGESPLAIRLANVEALTKYTWEIRQALAAARITGEGRREIDHIEVFGVAENPRAQAKNFVLCPGKSYDRSPCGTGTSAKLACLYQSGKLHPGETWLQESITGSLFEGSITIRDGLIFPRIKGSAFINSEASLIIDERDPLRWGIGLLTFAVRNSANREPAADGHRAKSGSRSVESE